MNCLLIASDEALPTGSGMQRRLYQIKHDLQEATGGDVHMFDAGSLIRRPLNGLDRVLTRLDQEWRRVQTNPLRLLGGRGVSVHELHRSARRALKSFAAQHGPFDRVVIDYPGYADAVKALNLRPGQWAYATHHLESMAQNQEALLEITRDTASSTAAWRQVRSAGAELAAELAVLGRASAVFPISCMETEFLRATGIEAQWYAYRPRGETLTWCKQIRRRRVTRQRSVTPFFLSTGTGNFHNRETLAEALRNLAKQGLPPGTKMVITSMAEEVVFEMVPELREKRDLVHVRGYVTDHELELLLASCEAQIVPSGFGFGARTRAADSLACGVPVVTDRWDGSLAQGATAGVLRVERGHWRAALHDALALPCVLPEAESESELHFSPLLLWAKRPKGYS